MSYDLQSTAPIILNDVSLAQDPDLYIQSDYSGMPATPAIALQVKPAILKTWDVSMPYGAQPPILSRLRVKRPDGTWATVVQVKGVHIQMPDGTWQVIE